MASELAKYKRQVRHEATVEANLQTIDERLARIEAHLGVPAADADGADPAAEAPAKAPKAGRK